MSDDPYEEHQNHKQHRAKRRTRNFLARSLRSGAYKSGAHKGLRKPGVFDDAPKKPRPCKKELLRLVEKELEEDEQTD